MQKHTGEIESVVPLKNSQCYDPSHPSGLGVGSGKGGWNRTWEGGLQKGLFARAESLCGKQWCALEGLWGEE